MSYAMMGALRLLNGTILFREITCPFLLKMEASCDIDRKPELRISQKFHYALLI